MASLLSTSAMTSSALARLRFSGFLLGCLLVLLSVGAAAAAAPSAHLSTATASNAKISAHLTTTSFTSPQAGSVKLIYRFTAPSKHFNYLLTLKKGIKWVTVKSVKKTGSFRGSHTVTVKKLFAGKSVKVGSYRLKLSVDTGSKLLTFKVVKAKSGSSTSGSSTPKPGLWKGDGISFSVSGNQVENIEIAASGETVGCRLVQSISDTFYFPASTTEANDQFSAKGLISDGTGVDAGNVSGTFHSATSAGGSMRIDSWWPTCNAATNGVYMGSTITLGPVNWSATRNG